MNLKNKKKLAARTLNVGLERISLNPERFQEIQEAITKQDIRDLLGSGAISVKEARGRKSRDKGKRRGPGKIKKKIRNRKHRYIMITRKLRKFARQLKLQDRISKEQYKEIRKQIRARTFRSKLHFKELVKPGEKQGKSEKVKKTKQEAKEKSI